ncbi:SDR family NAD(P)-dependent oxidoreductase [Candidatus Pinguicoccus supinus]|uniref:SDR family NAD(P)-dependent oxidoreductase n=1 Tax=Candidatus Pinguicoccus supinus TaxID=2529394 RepID=A0A7T0FYA4_9BACT|nr:SDR family NAD(P)-dependent oxidoreductase [Candidatus Pinguicoccus supinus]
MYVSTSYIIIIFIKNTNLNLKMFISIKLNVIIITGVSTGIGFFLSKLFLLNDFFVLGIGNRCNFLLNIFNNFYFFKINLKYIENFNKVRNIFGCFRYGALTFNNAGYSSIQKIHNISLKSLKQQINTMFFYPKLITDVNYSAQKRKKYGYVFSMCSIGGLIPIPKMGTYSICKSTLFFYIKC